MAQAKFISGDPIMLDYTPGADVAAGDVVVVGDLALIAHNAILSGKLGALAAGGGTYEVIAATSAAVGVVVYWVDADSEVSTSANSGANKRIGFILPSGPASAADGDTTKIFHKPAGVA